MHQAKDIVEICGVDITTARKWLTDTVGISPSHCKLLTMAANEWLLPDQWKGVVKFRKGHMIIRETDCIELDTIIGWHNHYLDMQLTKKRIEELEQELQEKNRLIEQLQKNAIPETYDNPDNISDYLSTLRIASNE